ncbi:hypothetical protein KC678_00985 [Candidatus Dojkabacteria bacterium]|uniref:beta-lactamase n=1 Tax=Candidatus Dojkabacteria bacterium TaxID=2099670 RepID=A0A955I8F4_9BACT|nr:hypothetical protein [Candidatus Dojkabacteria bacterium]
MNYKKYLSIPIQYLYMLGITVVIMFAGFSQIIEGNELNSTSLQFVVDKDVVEAPRGKILDVKGRVLAEDVKDFDIYLNYSSELENEYNQVVEYLGENNLEDTKKLLKSIDFDLDQNQRIFELLDSSQVEVLNPLLETIPNLEVSSRYVRHYNYPYQFTHILGYTGLVEAQDVIENGYGNEDFIGKYRIEKLYEDDLRGTSGQTIHDGLSEISIPPIEGDSIYLSIDAHWQNQLYRQLEEYNNRNGAAGGAAVIMDSETGEVKAMVSYPGFDTNAIVRGLSPESFNILQTARSQPLLDKAVAGSYTPGSIFKLITSYSLLNNNIITKASTFFSNQCLNLGGGFEFCEFGRNFYGLLDLPHALMKSSNLYFCNYSLELSKDKGLSYFVADAQKFGIGSPTGINLESEASGTMDSPTRKLEVTGDGWFDGDTCNAVIGQGAITTSPLQMAVVVSMIENGGKKLQPNIVYKIRHSDGVEEYLNQTTVLDNIEIPDQIINSIKEGMSGVAYNNASAVSRFFTDLKDFNIHAKTGSAETLENLNGVFVERVHGWIVGTFDKDGKTYTFSFFQQYGGGGYYIAPMLKDFLQNI